MRSTEGWIRYFRDALARAERELADFDRAVAERGLRIRHRTVEGERDVTAEQRESHVRRIEEYRAALRDE